MKKSHFALLLITALTAFFSAYSLGAMNKIYNIHFEWYSQYHEGFSPEKREAFRDKWQLGNYPHEMKFGIIGTGTEAAEPEKAEIIKGAGIKTVDLKKFILIYCTLGKVYSPEYRIKFKDIAQRGNVVELIFSVNSPVKLENQKDIVRGSYYPVDIIKIDKNAFTSKGELLFVFKNQDGNWFYETRYSVR